MTRATHALGILAVLSGAAAGQQMYTRTDLNVAPAAPGQMESGDFDGDGDRDLVTANGYGDFTVLQNDGQGGFTVAFTQGLNATMAWDISPVDLDADGDLDLAFATDAPNRQVRLLDNQGGTFRNGRLLTTGVEAHFIVAADLQRDGLPDVTAVNQLGELYTWQNQGGFAFAPPATYSLGYQAWGFAAGDFDGRNGIDLVGHDRNGGYTARTLLNDGTGAFVPGPFVQGVERFLHAADLDGDGLDDIATFSFGVGPYAVAVLWSTGAGFVPLTYSAARPAGPVRPGDLDGDGQLDLVAVNNYLGASQFSVFTNEGARQMSGGTAFSCGMTFGTHSYPTGLVVDDLDPADPAPDIATCGGYSEVSVFLRTPQPWPELELRVLKVNLIQRDLLSFYGCHGQYHGPALLAIVQENDRPAFVPMARQPFERSGLWRFWSVIPPGLAGHTFQFTLFGVDRSGAVSASNQTPVWLY